MHVFNAPKGSREKPGLGFFHSPKLDLLRPNSNQLGCRKLTHEGSLGNVLVSKWIIVAYPDLGPFPFEKTKGHPQF